MPNHRTSWRDKLNDRIHGHRRFRTTRPTTKPTTKEPSQSALESVGKVEAPPPAPKAPQAVAKRPTAKKVSRKPKPHPIIDAHIGAIEVVPRREYSEEIPGYLESDRDWVLNNIEACVAFLEAATLIKKGKRQ